MNAFEYNIKSHRATLKDIASILSVSISTVSKALKGSSEISISTKEKVKNTASSLNYKPNIIAAALRNNRSWIIGVILPDLKDSFYLDSLIGITEESSKNDYKIMVYQTCNDYEKEITYTKLLSESNIIDGLIFSSIANNQISKIDEHLNEIAAQGLPIVYMKKDNGFKSHNFSQTIGFNTGQDCVKKLLSKIEKNHVNLNA